jgi:hypothetical protein
MLVQSSPCDACCIAGHANDAIASMAHATFVSGFVIRASSHERFDVRSHDRRDPIRLRRLEDRVDCTRSLPQILPQRFERNIESDMTPIAEAIGNGLGWARDADDDAID